MVEKLSTLIPPTQKFKNMNKSQQIDYFYGLSEVLTGYNLVKLYGTGQGEVYFDTVKDILGDEIVGELLSQFEIITEKHNTKKGLTKAVRNELNADAKWGPVCKNINLMWYMGKWYQMPTDWSENNISSELDVDKVISPNSYIEGLVWEAMGQHPQSAKQPGYGTWAFPPNQN